jgi:hypothetical protein
MNTLGRDVTLQEILCTRKLASYLVRRGSKHMRNPFLFFLLYLFSLISCVIFLSN